MNAFKTHQTKVSYIYIYYDRILIYNKCNRVLKMHFHRQPATNNGTKAPINFTKMKTATSAIHGLTCTWCLWCANLVKLVPDFDFGQSQGLILAKLGSDFGEFKAEFEQIQGVVLVNSRLNLRNSRLNLACCQIQG